MQNIGISVINIFPLEFLFVWLVTENLVSGHWCIKSLKVVHIKNIVIGCFEKLQSINLTHYSIFKFFDILQNCLLSKVIFNWSINNIIHTYHNDVFVMKIDVTQNCYRTRVIFAQYFLNVVKRYYGNHRCREKLSTLHFV